VKRSVIKKLQIDEISMCGTPVQKGAVVAIIKSADGLQKKPVTKLIDIKLEELSLVERGANPYANIAIAKAAPPPVKFTKTTAAGEESIRKMIAAMRSEPLEKSAERENQPMPASAYEKLIADRMNAKGESRNEAIRKIHSDPSDSGLNDAYAADEAAAASRRARDYRAS
jgi:hypothetical protein